MAKKKEYAPEVQAILDAHVTEGLPDQDDVFDYGCAVKVQVRVDRGTVRPEYETEVKVPRRLPSGKEKFDRRRAKTGVPLIPIDADEETKAEAMKALWRVAEEHARKWAAIAEEQDHSRVIEEKYFANEDTTIGDVLDFYENAVVKPKVAVEMKKKSGRGYWYAASRKILALREHCSRYDNGEPIPVRAFCQADVDRYVERRRAEGPRNEVDMPKTELRLIADDLKIAGRSRMRKAQLVAAVEEATGRPAREVHAEWAEENCERDHIDDILEVGQVGNGTLSDDLAILARAVKAAQVKTVKGRDGTHRSVVPYNPFKDAELGITFPEATEMPITPILDYANYDAMLAAAGSEDERLKEYYAKQSALYPVGRHIGYSEAMLRMARRTGRRRAALLIPWEDIVTDPEQIRRVVRRLLGGTKLTVEEIRELFPYGIIVWRREKDKKGYLRFSPISADLWRTLVAFAKHHPNCPGGDAGEGTVAGAKGPLFYHPKSTKRDVTPRMMTDYLDSLFTAGGVEKMERDGWHMFRRLFRTERTGRDTGFSNKIVAYCGGWSKINKLDHVLDVDMDAAMNQGYLATLAIDLYLCMMWDGSKAPSRDADPLAGQHPDVRAQAEAEGYLGTGRSDDEEPEPARHLTLVTADDDEAVRASA